MYNMPGDPTEEIVENFYLAQLLVLTPVLQLDFQPFFTI
jgi:hypothetical protein